MPIPHDAPDEALPRELQIALSKAHGDASFRHRLRIMTPVEGNPHGGFPGLNLSEHGQELRSARRALITRFNYENPDYEYVAPPPPEKPPVLTDEEIKVARRRMAMRDIDHKHNEHVDKFLMENHAEHEHAELREYVEYERQMPFNERMQAIEQMKAKGLNPDDLKHRHEHHQSTSVSASSEQQTSPNPQDDPNA